MAKPNVVKLPSANVIASLISKSKNIKAKTSELNGDLGSAIAKAADDHNLHPAAFKTIRKLMGMDAVKLMAWLTHFDDYREKMQLDKLAAPDLPGMGDGEKDDDEEEPETETPPATPPGTEPEVTQTIQGTDGSSATIQTDASGRPKPMFDA